MQKRTERTEKPLCSHRLVSLSGDPLQPFRSGVTNNRRITSYNYSRRIEVTNNRNQLVLCWHSSYGGRQHLFRLSLVLVFGFEIVFCYCFQWERAVASHLKFNGKLENVLKLHVTLLHALGPRLIWLSKSTQTLSHTVDSEAIWELITSNLFLILLSETQRAASSFGVIMGVW